MTSPGGKALNLRLVATRSKGEDKRRCVAVVRILEEVRQQRELASDESNLLSWARSRLDMKRELWRWSEREDRKLKAFIATRPIAQRYTTAKPFQENSEVRDLANDMGRTVWAVYRRIERLRKARNCSNAARQPGA